MAGCAAAAALVVVGAECVGEVADEEELTAALIAGAAVGSAGEGYGHHALGQGIPSSPEAVNPEHENWKGSTHVQEEQLLDALLDTPASAVAVGGAAAEGVCCFCWVDTLVTERAGKVADAQWEISAFAEGGAGCWQSPLLGSCWNFATDEGGAGC